LEKLLALKEKYGFRIVCDVDDWWYLDKHHILYDEYQETGFAQKQIEHMRAADIVLTTHERLAESIEDVLEPRVDPFHPFVVRPEVHVCPNAIPPEGQFSPQTYALRKMSSPYVRLFWQGSITHRRDIEILQWPIHQLRRIAKNVKMVMAGYHDGDAEWDAMARIYTAGMKHQYKLIPGGKATEYYQAYEEADICLVPLVNSPFNRMKSNLKILEAANLGLPVVASAVHPYLDMPVNYCRTGRDWEQHIKRLVQWPKRREEEGQRLAEFCKEHYNFHKINNERRQILEYAATKARI
jgi:glycosyltransferase involved in cell wall biosynthesis